jgi:hypothetical protein
MDIWTKHQLMISLWVGVIVMGLAYFFGLKTPEESSAFILGQVVLGCIGLMREMHLKKYGFKRN